MPGALPDLSTREGLVALWRSRGLHSLATASIGDLPGAGDYPDLPLAVECLKAAAADGRRIVIVGDYDCDGVTSTTLLVRALRRLGIEPIVRLPHRIHDGYGLTPALATEVGELADLIVTVDTGVTAAPSVALLRERGKDVVVIDHHHPTGEIPEATALIHPLTTKRTGPWPSAAGLAFMVAQTLAPTTGHEQDVDLALAMLGTIADVVVLTGDNRTLVHLGLEALERLSSGPLAEMRDMLRTGSPALSATDVAFRLAPRINAAGRLGDPTVALHALLEGGENLAELERLNADRQQRTKIAVDAAVAKILHQPTLPPILHLSGADLHPGILGLVAAKLTEQFGRPSLVACERDGLCTASLRGPSSYHLAEGLTACADLLERFGGHAQAAGCTVRAENLPDVLDRLSSHITQSVPVEALQPTLQIDGLINAHALTVDLMKSLTTFEPFGAGNPSPRVMIQGVTIDGARSVGEKSKHLQGRVGSAKCIGFGLGHLVDHAHDRLDIVGRLSLDTWNGRVSAQLILDDLRPAR